MGRFNMNAVLSKNPQESRNLIQVFSSGGGTQSACIAALICLGRLPKPDFAVIADTGREKPTTWLYLNQVIIPNLAKAGVEIVRIGSEWQSVPEHGKNWLSHNGRTILLPGYSNISGEVGKFSGYCSTRWKIEVVDRWFSKTNGITRSKFQKWIGFSLDEAKRVAKLIAGQEYHAGLLRIPLVFDVPFRRHQSVTFVEKMGWPTPPRSACYDCPNQRDDEWLDIKRNFPVEWESACQREDEVRAKDPYFYFHQSCVPLREVVFDEEPDLFGDHHCDSGVCFV
jgi:hypothetical protein